LKEANELKALMAKKAETEKADKAQKEADKVNKAQKEVEDYKKKQDAEAQ